MNPSASSMRSNVTLLCNYTFLDDSYADDSKAFTGTTSDEKQNSMSLWQNASHFLRRL